MIRKLNIRLAPEAVRDAYRNAQAAITRGVHSGARRGRAHLISQTPKDTGLMKASWKDSYTSPTGRNARLAEITNTAPYAGIIEAGARPHKVSKEGRMAIYQWVRRHFGFMRAGRDAAGDRYRAVPLGHAAPGRVMRGHSKTGKARTETGKAGVTELMRVTDLIIRKLETKGQKGTFFVKNSQPKLHKFVELEVSRELRAMHVKRPRKPKGGGTP